MALYEAKHYLRVGTADYIPGEVVDEALTEKQTARLLKLGAIREIRTERSVPERREEAVSAESAYESTAADRSEEYADEEDVPAPEIDVTDGIGAAPKAPKNTGEGGKKK